MAFSPGSDDLNHASRSQWQATTRVTKQLDAKLNNSNQAPGTSPSSYTLGALSGNIGLKLHSVEVFLFINVHAHMCTSQVPTSPESTTKVIMVGRSVVRSGFHRRQAYMRLRFAIHVKSMSKLPHSNVITHSNASQ